MHCGIVVNMSNRKSDTPDAPRDDILSMIRGSADIYGPAAYTIIQYHNKRETICVYKFLLTRGGYSKSCYIRLLLKRSLVVILYNSTEY